MSGARYSQAAARVERDEDAAIKSGAAPMLRFAGAQPHQTDDITSLQRAAIAAIPSGIYEEPCKAAWWRTSAKRLDKLIEQGRYYVILHNGRPVAGAGWEPIREKGSALLRAVFVDPAMAGHGLGAKCVTRVEAEVRAAGYDRLLVPSALNAVGFYRRLGYRPSGWGHTELEEGILLTYRRLEKVLGAGLLRRPVLARAESSTSPRPSRS